MRWRYRAGTAAEVAAIASWYRERSSDASERFLVALEELYARLATFPRLGEPVEGVEARRVQVDRFPYLVYYEILDDVLEIFAVVHHARHESVWRSKLEE